MPDIDQRSDTERRGADRRFGISIGRTALTGYVLAAVLGLASVGTAVGATPGAGGGETPHPALSVSPERCRPG